MEGEEHSTITEGITLHSLRHTYASLLFEAGATVPYVMNQLGHADPGVTLRIYAHVLERKRDTGARLDAVVGPAAVAGEAGAPA